MSKARELSQRAGVDGALSNRNLIINGSHIVNQRNITSVTTGVGSPTFTSDRWISYGNGLAVNITIQEVTLPDGTVANSHKTTATSIASGVWLHPYQRVETFRREHLRGRVISISTWVRTNMTSQRIRICDTVSCYELGDEIPSDGQWHYVTASYTMPSGMATGVSDYVQIHPAFGTTNVVSGSYIEFTLTQFELGDTATPFEHRSYGQELALCQRYYWRRTKEGNQAVGTGTYYQTTSFYVPINFPVQMRATPTFNSSSGTSYFRIYSANNAGDYFDAFSGVQANGSQNTCLYIGSLVSGTAGYAGWVELWNSSAYISFDAEL